MAFAQNLAQAKEQLGVGIGSSRLLVPLAFRVGNHENKAGQNLGSLAILTDASQRGLTVGDTLPLFAEHWESVQKNPDGTDHTNIRALVGIDRGTLVSDIFETSGNPLLERQTIEAMWDDRANVTPNSDGRAVFEIIAGLDCGGLRIASKVGDDWVTDQTLKQAVLLSFRLRDNQENIGDQGNNLELRYWDKVPTKFAGWTADEFRNAGFRVVPGAGARRGGFIAKNVILMPSYVNIGAYVDEGTMVDTWATVGSCAQIGKNVHLSGGVGIGGVLEPLQANPTIIEDDCFIGARSEVVEGVIVGKGSVLGMGVFLAQSTPVWDRNARKWLDSTGGLKIPPYSVVISGQKPAKELGDPTTYCAVIVKTVDAGTRAKTNINELLRD